MPADPLRTITPGEPMADAVTSDLLNALIAQARHTRANRFAARPVAPGGNAITSGLTVLVRNDSPSALASCSILGVTGTPLDPAAEPHDFMRRPCLAGEAPASAATPIVVLREPIGVGEIGRGTIAGVCTCDVLINDSGHQWAKPIAGDVAKLESAASGPARILWSAGSSGVQRCVVNLLDGQAVGGGGSDPDADATTRGYVGVNTGVDQVLGDGNKTFQRRLIVNSSQTEYATGTDGAFIVRASDGSSAFRVQPFGNVPSGFYASYIHALEESLGTTNLLRLGEFYAYGRGYFRSLVAASGKNLSGAEQLNPGSIGLSGSLTPDPGIGLVGRCGSFAAPAVQACDTSTATDFLTLIFDVVNNRIIIASGTGSAGSAKLSVMGAGPGGNPADGQTGTMLYGGKSDGGVVTDLGSALATVATSGSYSDLSGTPSLATVATTGNYSDLTGTPSLAAVATSGNYSDLSGTPSLASVATSGSYSDLSGTPSLATVATTGNYGDLTGLPSLASVATSGTYSDLTGTPTLAAIATSGDSSDAAYSPANPGDWSGAPSNVKDAIDRLAAAVAGLLGGAIP